MNSIYKKNMNQCGLTKRDFFDTARFLKIFAKILFMIFMCFTLFMLSVRIQW